MMKSRTLLMSPVALFRPAACDTAQEETSSNSTSGQRAGFLNLVDPAKGPDHA